MNLTFWLNSAWMFSCFRESRAFYAATEAVADSQLDTLTKIIKQNTKCRFGEKYEFDSIQSIQDFQKRVPLSTYEDYTSSITKIAEGERSVLTSEAVTLFEPTSGSTQGEKLIPYTASLRKEFQKALAVWVAVGMRKRPGIRRGRAYLGISPALGQSRMTPSGIPIGFDDDTEYFSWFKSLLIKRIMAVPAGISKVTSIENFQYCTLLHLLAADDLAFISIWSPTFLTSLLSRLEVWEGSLLEDLRRGRATIPNPHDPGITDAVLFCKCSKSRIRQLGSILKSNVQLPEKTRRLWNQLDSISCWADASASDYVGNLRRLFPGADIQPKGLMSTEACVSFPLMGYSGTPISIRSHFFEFVPLKNNAVEDRIYLVDELKMGEQYEVVVTTGGGLYRYQTKDVIEVVGVLGQCPLIVFKGRADRVSDLVGEKLTESFVSQVLREAFGKQEVETHFSMLVPARNPAGYRLYFESNLGDISEATKRAVLKDVAEGLNRNPYYRYALKLGQLKPLEVFARSSSEPRMWLMYEKELLRRGQKAGAIKPAALDTWDGWHDVFCNPNSEAIIN